MLLPYVASFYYLLTPGNSHPLPCANRDNWTAVWWRNPCYCRDLKNSTNEGASVRRNECKQLLHPSATEMLTNLHSEARQYYYCLYRGYQRDRGLRMVVRGMTATVFQGIQLPMSSATVLSSQNIPRSWKSWKYTAKGCAKKSPPPPQ